MKGRRISWFDKKKASVVLLGIVFLLSMVTVPVSSDDGSANSRAYTAHNPIVITTDLGFTSANGVTGGSGSSSDPYIISGWEITSTGQDAILVSATNAHFSIKDCKIVDVTGGNHGVLFNSVNNGAIDNTIFDNNQHGIAFQSSTNSDIIDSTFTNNVNAISLESSSNIDMTGNSIDGATNGISFASSNSNVFEDNEITGSTNAIDVASSNANTITKNKLTGGTYGISMASSDNNIITYNDFINHPQEAITAATTMGNKIHHNNFKNNNGMNKQATSTSAADEWDDGSEGNYWSDWITPDADTDGIVDLPYDLDGNVAHDHYPLTTEVGGTSPAPLTASSSADVTSGDYPLQVSFTGSAAGGKSPYTYAWDFGDSSTGTGASASHTYTTEGTFSAVLTVTDSASATKDATAITITVTKPIEPLEANVSADASEGMAPYKVVFTATQTGGVGPYTYTWDYGDGTIDSDVTISTASHTYDDVGTYTVKVTIKDNEGTTDSATVTSVKIFAAMTVNITASKEKGTAPVTVEFTSSISGGKAPYTMTWTFEEGQTSTETNPTYKFKKKGIYTVKLTVEDSLGNKAEKTIVIDVKKKSEGGPGFEMVAFVMAIVIVALILGRKKNK